jgi:rare lipoprotein A
VSCARIRLLIAIVSVVLTSWQVGFATEQRAPSPRSFSGNISWYGAQFHGHRTASGRIFDMNKLTCAHRTLPFGTRIQVENPRNGKVVVVEVIDRGPYAGGRVMDISREAARQLGTLLGGISYVNCLVIDEKCAPTREASDTEFSDVRSRSQH